MTLPIGSPGWWLDNLNRRLNDRQTGLQKRHDYYYGQHPLLFATDEFLEVFQDMLKPLAVNFVSLVVDAPLERLQIQGFRVGDETGADEEANRIWMANSMAERSRAAHRLALSMSESAIIVWSGADARTPRISIEDPRQIIVDYDPENPMDRRAALKRWNDTDKAYCTLYLPDAIYKYEQPLSAAMRDKVARSTQTIVTSARGSWNERQVEGEEWPLPNPTGVVPVVPMVNRADMFGNGASEMDSVLPLQDAINKLACDMLISSEFAAFRQRWMTGVDIPKDPKTGEQIVDFRAAVDRILSVSDPNARMGEFAATDLKNYVAGIETFVQQMASISHTPPHYLLGRSGVIPSGEATTSAESGLVSKVRAHQVEKDPVWTEVMRVAFLVIGDRERAARQMTGIWTDPERRSRSELMDSLVKERALGIPDEYLWSRAGYGPTEIQQIQAIRQRQQRELAQAWDPRAQNFDPAMLAQLTEAFGQLYRAGVDPIAAMTAVGLPALPHTGDAPVTTRPDEEGAGGGGTPFG